MQWCKRADFAGYKLLTIRDVIVCQFICGVFNDAVNIWDYITSTDLMMINYELEILRKEAVVS